jgi:hypothetical protein
MRRVDEQRVALFFAGARDRCGRNVDDAQRTATDKGSMYVEVVAAGGPFLLTSGGKIARRLCLQRDDYWKKGIVGYRKHQGTPRA